MRAEQQRLGRLLGPRAAESTVAEQRVDVDAGRREGGRAARELGQPDERIGRGIRHTGKAIG
jgi:hypothetical protein